MRPSRSHRTGQLSPARSLPADPNPQILFEARRPMGQPAGLPKSARDRDRFLRRLFVALLLSPSFATLVRRRSAPSWRRSTASHRLVDRTQTPATSELCATIIPMLSVQAVDKYPPFVPPDRGLGPTVSRSVDLRMSEIWHLCRISDIRRRPRPTARFAASPFGR